MDQNNCCDTEKRCSCFHHSMFGVWMMLIGLLFLLGHFEVIGANIVSMSWPIVLMLAGLQKAFQHKCKCC